MVSGQTGWYGWMGGLEEWMDGWSRRFVYYDMGVCERDSLLMGMGGFIHGYRNGKVVRSCIIWVTVMGDPINQLI